MISLKNLRCAFFAAMAGWLFPHVKAALPLPQPNFSFRRIYLDEQRAREDLAEEQARFFGRPEAQFRAARAAQQNALKGVSVRDVRLFMAKPEKLVDVLNAFGLPFFASIVENEIVLSYELPAEQPLIFWVRGDYVDNARYAQQDIRGSAPPSHRMEAWESVRLALDPAAETSTPKYKFDDQILSTYSEFEKRLLRLKPGAVLIWQLRCDSSEGTQLSSVRDRERFAELCRGRGIRLIIRPAG